MASSHTNDCEERPPRIGSKLLAQKRILLRVGVEKTSACTEILQPGSTLVVLETAVSSTGQMRVRCAQGWVSTKAEGGEVLLKRGEMRPEEAAIEPTPNLTPAALPSDGPAQAPSKSPDAVLSVGVMDGVTDGRDAASVTVGTAGEKDEQLPPQSSVGEASTVAATAGLAVPGAAGANPPASAPAPAPIAVEEVTRLKQQLALAHQELDRLKAASSAGTATSAELARAAVQLTASAYGNGGSALLSSPSVPALGIARPGPEVPVSATGTWAGGMSPFARARRHQAEMMSARQGAWTLGSNAGRSRSGLGPPPPKKSPRPTSAANGWQPSRQAVSRGNGTGSPRSRSVSRLGRDALSPDSFGARQVKIDQWIDEWCVRQGIAGHGGVVRKGLEKAMIEPQDWVTTLRNLSDAEMLEFLAAAREAGRTERRQQRRLAEADARMPRSGGQSSPVRWQQDHAVRMSSPSPRRRRVEAYESSQDTGIPPSPQRGVHWGEPPVRGSLDEIGGMALQRPPSPSGSPRRPTSPLGVDRRQEAWTDTPTNGSSRKNRAAVDMIVQRRSSHRLSSPTTYGGNRHSRRQAQQREDKQPAFGLLSPTGRLPAEGRYASESSTPKADRSGGLPVSPRKPLVWSEGLVKGVRVFVEDSESPYANQYGEIVEVSQSTVKILCDEQFHGDRPRVVRMASVVLADHPGLPKQRSPRAGGDAGRSARTVAARRR